MPRIIPVVEPGRNETDIGALYPSSTRVRRSVSVRRGPSAAASRQTTRTAKLRVLGAVRPTTMPQAAGSAESKAVWPAARSTSVYQAARDAAGQRRVIQHLVMYCWQYAQITITVGRTRAAGRQRSVVRQGPGVAVVVSRADSNWTPLDCSTGLAQMGGRWPAVRTPGSTGRWVRSARADARAG